MSLIEKMEIPALILDNRNLLIGLSIVWCIAVLTGLALWHARQDPWHPPMPDSQRLFSERFVSGFSHKNLLTRLSGARSALSVKVYTDAVLVEFIAPFKWVMPQGFNDLQHFILRTNIKKISMTSRFGSTGVLLDFVSDKGEPKRIELFLRHRSRFLSLLA